MPTTVTGLLVAGGVLLIVAALFGGGLEIKEIKIPTIAIGARILSFVVGSTLIALALFPDFPTSSWTTADVSLITEPEENGPVDQHYKALIKVVGLSEDEARRSIGKLGLQIGKVSNQSIWAADGYVVQQIPEEETPVQPGAVVDIVVASSNFTFRVERKLISKEETLTAVTEYDVRRFRPGGEVQDFGEFKVTKLEVTPTESNLQRIIDNLVLTRGDVPIESMSEFKLDAYWEAFADLGQDLGESFAEETVSEGNHGFKSLGKVAWITMLSLEAEFDIRSIFSESPGSAGSGSGVLDLQIGTEMKSAIRVEGQPAIIAAGEDRSFVIVRRSPNGDEFKKIGRATYSTNDGFLRKLDASFYIGDSEDAFYKVEIRRL